MRSSARLAARGETERERDRLGDREGLSRRFAGRPWTPLPGGGLLRRGGGEREYDGLRRRRRGGLILRLRPAGVPLRLRTYLRGGDLERLRERAGERDARRRLAGGLRLGLSLKRRSRSRRGVGDSSFCLRLFGGGERDSDREADRRGERRGGLGLRPGDLRLGGGERVRDRERELLSREAELRLGGDLNLRGGGDRERFGEIDRDL